MKTKLVMAIGVFGFIQSGCFHARIDTNYATDSDRLVASMRHLPAVAGFVFSEEDRQRHDSVWHFGIKVTVDTGTPVYELSKACVSKVFDETITFQKIELNEKTDLFLEPKIDDLFIRVDGFAYAFFTYVEVAGYFSLNAYDSKGALIWTGKREVNYRSGREILAFQSLILRNKIATATYTKAFLPKINELFSEFYYSRELQNYLCSIGKCAQQSLEESHPAWRAQGTP